MNVIFSGLMVLWFSFLANVPLSESSSPEKSDFDLTKAAEAANKLFGPCTVQKVQLKNGKTVFAYKPEVSKSGSYPAMNSDTPVRSTLPLNTNGVRNLDEVFSAINASKSNCNQNKSNVPEEIVILDSDDEDDDIHDSTLSRTHSEVLNEGEHSKESDSKGNNDSDSEKEELYIDESCSPNTSNRWSEPVEKLLFNILFAWNCSVSFEKQMKTVMYLRWNVIFILDSYLTVQPCV